MMSAAKDSQTDWRDFGYVEACERPWLHQLLGNLPQIVSSFACLTAWNCSMGVGSVLGRLVGRWRIQLLRRGLHSCIMSI